MNNLKKINDILKEVTQKKKKFNPKKNLFEQGLDSLDLTTLLITIEEKFDLSFKSNAYDKLASINDIMNYIKKNKKKR